MSTQRQHRILVADDDARGLHFLKGLLGNEGYEIVAASDGPEALALAESTIPDAILLDVMMPGMDGFEVCRKLRANPVLSPIPIILLTALDDRESKLEGLEAGADDFLTKPFDATELIVRLKTIARLNRFRQLSEERERFERIVEFSPHAIVLVDEECRILLANREFMRIGTLASCEEANGQDLRDWFVGNGGDLLLTAMQQALDNPRSKPVETRLCGDADVEPTPVELTASLIPWQGRKVFQLVIQDLAEKKKLEGQVMRFQRIELLGEMAGSIVHDMNNVLSAISGNMSLIELQNDLSAEAKSRIGTIQTSVQRGTGILRQLLSFTRGSDGDFSPVSLPDLVGEVVELVHPMMKYDYQIERVIDDTVPVIEADANQLHQVLMNLCVNARDAMPDGGTLTLTVGQRKVTPAEAEGLAADAKPGLYASVSVRDTGTGMPPEVRNRIFAPFFTTKPPGKGTGLGLATVLRLVRRHKGFITVDSEPGKGTCFTCHLPAVE